MIRCDRLIDQRAAIAAPLCAVLLAWLAPAPAVAQPQLSWSAAVEIDPVLALNGVSCASDARCVAVDEHGQALLSADPVTNSWSAPQAIDSGHPLLSVSCAPASTLCVAADGDGRVLVSDSAGAQWSEPLDVDGTNAIGGVACASTALCVAVDGNGDAIVSGTPGVAATSSWSVHAIDSGHVLTGVSCALGLPCVAVDSEGRGLTSADPGEGAWAPIRALHAAAGAGLTAVACAGELPPTPAPPGLCVAVGEAGEALASGDPAAGGSASWGTTPLEIGPLTAVSCQAAGLCVAVDESGGVYAGDGPTTTPSWTPRGSIDAPHKLTGVSCVAEGLCVAVDNVGHALVARVPPPILTTTPPEPVSVAETAASLSGTVDTNDATLSSCRFEYGTSEAYGQSVPCPTLLAGSANQPVSFFLTGLTPNVTYDYRVVAVSASGEARTANATFKTPSPPLVQPHPSIGGIPAPGQRLTCKSGVSGAGASSATLTYAWLRDTRAISGASGSTYVVGGADISHHLQCRVTATNAGGSASAASAFVTVPAGGLGSISETQVGTQRVAR
ncbi:MAG TPA: hypothetical protein VNV37_10035, partial [Solirubrobacteraceae bacterium]|nr:hypothetical protein [Solirubrobacteraceae bacterium]